MQTDPQPTIFLGLTEPYRGSAGVSYRTYTHPQNDDPGGTTANSVPSDYDLSAIPFRTTAPGLDGLGVSGGLATGIQSSYDQAISDQQTTLTNVQTAVSQAQTQVDTDAANYAAAKALAVPALAAYQEALAAVAAAQDELDSASNQEAHAGKFGQPADQQAAADRFNAAQIALQAAQAQAQTAQFAFAIPGTDAGEAARQWEAHVLNRDLLQDQRDSAQIALTLLQTARGAAPSSYPTDGTGVTPYATAVLASPGNLGSSLRSGRTYLGSDSQAHCILGEYNYYSLTGGEYLLYFTVPQTGITALKNSGFTTVRLTWYEVTRTIPLVQVTHTYPPPNPYGCADYTTLVQDNSAHPTCDYKLMSEDIDLDASFAAETLDEDPAYGAPDNKLFRSSVHTLGAPGANNGAIVTINVVTGWTMPLTVLGNSTAQGGSAARVGWYENETGADTPAPGVQRYLVQQADNVPGTGPPVFSGQATLTGSLDAGFSYASSIQANPVGPLPLAVYENPLASVPYQQAIPYLEASERDTATLDPTVRTYATTPGLRLTLSDPLSSGQVAAAGSVAASADYPDPNDPEAVYYGSYDSTPGTVNIQGADGNFAAQQKFRFQLGFENLGDAFRTGDTCPFRYRRTETNLLTGVRTVTYPDASQVFGATGYFGDPANPTMLDEPVPGPNTRVLIEGAPVEDTEANAASRIIGIPGAVITTSPNDDGPAL